MPTISPDGRFHVVKDKQLGKGSSGVAFLVRTFPPGRSAQCTKHVLKEIPMRHASHEQKKEAYQEVRIMMQHGSHPHIIEFVHS